MTGNETIRAVQVQPGLEQSARVARRPAPRRRPGECLVRVLDVGIDATDREIDAAEYGEAPAGETSLVIGHEAVGRVVQASEAATSPRAGDLVVPTVRRPCPELCTCCDNGQLDFCASGDYHERGIRRRHGYLRDAFTERPEYLVPVPASLRDVAVLLEPMSIVRKVFRQTWRIQERLAWRPKRVLVTGAGSIGMLATFVARRRGLETLVYSRGEARGAVATILDATGARYIDSNAAPLADVTREFGAPDLAIEATGYSPLAWESAAVLALNGVACLLGVTGGDRKAHIASDALNLALVLGNRLMFGSVSAARIDFEDGIDELEALRARWPDALASFITHRIGLDGIEKALRDPDPDELKTVVELAPDA